MGIRVPDFSLRLTRLMDVDVCVCACILGRAEMFARKFLRTFVGFGRWRLSMESSGESSL